MGCSSVRLEPTDIKKRRDHPGFLVGIVVVVIVTDDSAIQIS